MHRFAVRVSLLLLASGFCGLVYQMAWLRLLRLVFGASTAASAAVLAKFLEGKTMRREIYVPGRLVNLVAN
jgi:hypothetical protein